MKVFLFCMNYILGLKNDMKHAIILKVKIWKDYQKLLLNLE